MPNYSGHDEPKQRTHTDRIHELEKRVTELEEALKRWQEHVTHLEKIVGVTPEVGGDA